MNFWITSILVVVCRVGATVRRLVEASDNPYLTGVCAINMDRNVRDEQVTAIFEEVAALREEYAARLDAS